MKTEIWNAATYDAPRRRLVPCYDDFYGTAGELVARLAPPRPRLLDVGAGTGLLTAEVARRVELGAVTLFDGSQAMLEQARRRLAGFRPVVVEGDLRDPLPDGPFDAVVSALAIHHLSDADKRELYARIFEVLAPGGLFVNAEQVCHPQPAGQKVFESTHLEFARRRGSDPAEIEAAQDRMAHDLCAPAERQVGWLRELGFTLAAVYYQWFRFSVFGGCKPE